MRSADDLLASALELPADERGRLARELLRSLEGGADPTAEVAWEAEVRRRAQSLVDGSAQTLDGKAVLKSIAERIAAIRSQR